jgi:hypothetical protein
MSVHTRINFRFQISALMIYLFDDPVMVQLEDLDDLDDGILKTHPTR